ncbi:MAG: hypothetical protein JKY95_12475 [Planctomycetaceae bacterium]|nr:hypothetical protein [Planctomycetaceae bacterium]
MKFYSWAALLLLLVVVGCGGGETGAGSASEAENDPATAEMSEEDAAAEGAIADEGNEEE